MDAFTVTLPGNSGNSGDSTSQVWLYQNITEQVKASFPNAGVKTVVFAQIIELFLRRKLDLNTKNKLVDEELGFLNIIKEESSLFNTQKLFLYYYLFYLL